MKRMKKILPAVGLSEELIQLDVEKGYPWLLVVND